MQIHSLAAMLLTLGIQLAMNPATLAQSAESVPANAGANQEEPSEGTSRSFAYERPLIGADISWVPSQEDRGTRFSDQGEEKDVLEILTDHKFNWIRLRLFVDPTAENGYSRQGYCGLEQTLAMARQAAAANCSRISPVGTRGSRGTCTTSRASCAAS